MKKLFYIVLVLALSACDKEALPGLSERIEGVWRSDEPPFWTITASDGYLTQRIVSEGYCLEYAYSTDGDTLTLTSFSGDQTRRQVWRFLGDDRAEVTEIGHDVPVMILKKLSE